MAFIPENHFSSWWSKLIKKDPNIDSENSFENNLKNTIKKVLNEYSKKDIQVFPQASKLFRAFRETSFENCKYILVGQDPYHNVYNNSPSACGLSFVTENNYLNPSLRVLMESLEMNSKDPNIFKEFMLGQGVLLLNMSLTVERGKANSHTELWQEFTDELVQLIYLANPKIEWILLGSKAREVAGILAQRYADDKELPAPIVHVAPHPAYYSYKKIKDYKALKLLWKQLKWLKTL